MSARRELLSRRSRVASRESVFLIPGALEIDEIDHFDVTRQRVLFEEVLLITYTKRYGKLYLWMTGMGAAVMGALTVAAAFSSFELSIFPGVVAIPFAIAFLLRALLGLDVINVYGRRSGARLVFAFRKKRARDVYDRLVEQIRAAQSDGDVSGATADEVSPPPVSPSPE